MQGGHILREKQSENTQQPSTYSVVYLGVGAATTLKDTHAGQWVSLLTLR